MSGSISAIYPEIEYTKVTCLIQIMKIPSAKNQSSNKFQWPKFKIPNKWSAGICVKWYNHRRTKVSPAIRYTVQLRWMFWPLGIEIWDLFAIWCLGFEIWDIKQINSTSLGPIYWNHIMFAHDLRHSQIEYLSNSTRRTIDFNRKDRAKRYHKSSIPACPGWDYTNEEFWRILR